MRVLIESDVLLDVVLRREPHFQPSADLLDWAASHPGRAAVAWHSLSNVYYLTEAGADRFIEELLEFVEIPACGTAEMRQALEMRFSDLEDAMVAAAAIRFGAQAIATRNTGDFVRSPVKASTPAALLAVLR